LRAPGDIERDEEETRAVFDGAVARGALRYPPLPGSAPRNDVTSPLLLPARAHALLNFRRLLSLIGMGRGGEGDGGKSPRFFPMST